MLASMMLVRFLAAGLAFSLLLAADEIPALETANYVVGFLRKGPNLSPEDTPENRKIIAGHRANFAKIAAAGKLAEVGHFSDGGEVLAMFILKNTTLEEARKLLDADPAIKAKRLAVE